MDEKEYIKGLEKILAMSQVDIYSKDYLRYKAGLLKKNPDGSEITDSQFILPLGKIINPDDEEMFLNETQAFVENEVLNYKNQRKAEVEESFNTYKDKIISDYSKLINSSLELHVNSTQLENEKTLKKIIKDDEKEDKEKTLKRDLEIDLCQNLGTILKDFELSEDYKEDKELINSVKNLKELDKLEESEKQNAMAEYLINKNRLTQNYKNAARDWSNIYEQMKINYTLSIGRKFLKEQKGKYMINESLLKTAYGNIEFIKKIVYFFSKRKIN